MFIKYIVYIVFRFASVDWFSWGDNFLNYPLVQSIFIKDISPIAVKLFFTVLVFVARSC